MFLLHSPLFLSSNLKAFIFHRLMIPIEPVYHCKPCNDSPYEGDNTRDIACVDPKDNDQGDLSGPVEEDDNIDPYGLKNVGCCLLCLGCFFCLR